MQISSQTFTYVRLGLQFVFISSRSFKQLFLWCIVQHTDFDVICCETLKLSKNRLVDNKTAQDLMPASIETLLLLAHISIALLHLFCFFSAFRSQISWKWSSTCYRGDCAVWLVHIFRSVLSRKAAALGWILPVSLLLPGGSEKKEDRGWQDMQMSLPKEKERSFPPAECERLLPLSHTHTRGTWMGLFLLTHMGLHRAHTFAQMHEQKLM